MVTEGGRWRARGLIGRPWGLIRGRALKEVVGRGLGLGLVGDLKLALERARRVLVVGGLVVVRGLVRWVVVVLVVVRAEDEMCSVVTYSGCLAVAVM
jgi:hypothetical protein